MLSFAVICHKSVIDWGQNMDIRDRAKALRNQIDLRTIAAGYSTLSGREGDRLRKGPCPKCGGKDRFEVQRGMFFCRQCKPAEQGKGKHDAFEFVQWMGFASNFLEAYEWLARYAGNPSLVKPSQAATTTNQPAATINWQDATWQQKAQAEARSAVDRLAKAQTGKPGRDYLTSRGIEQATWEACGVGWGEGWNDGIKALALGVTIPWYAEDGQITSIQYRFVDGQGVRFGRFMYPKRSGGYTGQTILHRTPTRNSDTLIVCEGEINALSLWQATSYDVVSFGSESSKGNAATKQAIADLAQRYDRVLVWADKGKIAAELAALIGNKAKAIRSPKGKDGEKRDANDLLQMGMLTEIIERRLPSPCQAQPVAAPATDGDLTGYVGATVDDATWQALQQRLTLPEYEGWTLQARSEGDGWHIYRLHMAALADEGEQAQNLTKPDIVTA